MLRIIVGTLFLFSLTAKGQTWQRLVDNPFNFGGAEAYGVRIIADTIHVSSAFVVTDTISNTRAVITKHSIDDGMMLDYRQFKSETKQNSIFNDLNTGFNQLYPTEDSLLYLPLNIWSDDIDSVNQPNLLLINKSLNTVSAFPVTGFENDIFSTFGGSRIDVDGNILLYGSRSRNGLYFVADSANTLLVKMTPLGGQLWTKKYDDTYTINSLTPLSDGDIVFNTGWVAPSYQNTKRLIKTNSAGEEQWRITFGGMYTGRLSTMIETSSGRILTANSWNVTNSDEPGTAWWYRKWIQLQLINDLGTAYEIESDVKWAPTRNVEDVYGIEEMPDGNFLSWGIMQSTAGSTYDTIAEIWDKPFTRGFLFMVDNTLDSLWHRTYYYPDDDDILECYSTFRITDVSPLEDGSGFVTCGWGQIHGEDNLEKVWLMRLDEYGCLEPGCQNVNVTEILLGFENSMTVFPNPVQDICTIQWNLENLSTLQSNFKNTELIVTDSQGREVKRLPISNFGNHHQIQIDVTDFSAGIYQAHWVSGSSWLDTSQFIKE